MRHIVFLGSFSTVSPFPGRLFFSTITGMEVKNIEVKYHKLKQTALAYERSLDDMERELIRQKHSTIQLEEKCQRRLDQIQFLLKENAQLKFELETLREQFLLKI